MDKETKISIMWDLTADAIIDALSDPKKVSPGWVQCAERFLTDNGAEALSLPAGKKEQIHKMLPFPKLSDRKIG